MTPLGKREPRLFQCITIAHEFGGTMRDRKSEEGKQYLIGVSPQPPLKHPFMAFQSRPCYSKRLKPGSAAFVFSRMMRHG